MNDMNKCGRGAELVAYFYGEATDAERLSFERHLRACAACRDELAAFGGVRSAVGDWRAQIEERAPALSVPALLPEFARNGRKDDARTVQGVTQPTEDGAQAHAPSVSPATVLAPRSAWAALREFFALTPAWARAGLVAASLVVCALAALAVVNAEFRWDARGVAFNTRLRGQEVKRTTAAPSQPTTQQNVTVAEARYTRADIERLTAERDAARADLGAALARLDAAQQQVAGLNASLTKQRAQYQTLAATVRTPRNAQSNGRNGARQFVANNNDPEEEGLQLSDLLTEVSAGQEPPQVKQNRR